MDDAFRSPHARPRNSPLPAKKLGRNAEPPPWKLPRLTLARTPHPQPMAPSVLADVAFAPSAHRCRVPKPDVRLALPDIAVGRVSMSAAAKSIIADLESALHRKGLREERITRLLQIAGVALPTILARLFCTSRRRLPCKRRVRRDTSPDAQSSAYTRALSLPFDVGGASAKLQPFFSLPKMRHISLHHYLHAPAAAHSASPTERLALYFHLCDFFDTLSLPLSSSDIFMKYGTPWSLLKFERLHANRTHREGVKLTSSMKTSLTTPLLPHSVTKHFCPQLFTSPLPSNSELTSTVPSSSSVPAEDPPSPPPTETDIPLIPKILTWPSGDVAAGDDVAVSGSWDNWASETPMYSNGTDHIALLYIPRGEHQCRFRVKQEWRCHPLLSSCTDDDGNNNTIIHVVDEELEFDSMAPLVLQDPPSPISSYDQSEKTEFAHAPLELPPILELRSLKSMPDDINPSVTALLRKALHGFGSMQDDCHSTGLDLPAVSPRAGNSTFFSHVFLNHLYQSEVKAKDSDDDGILYLSQTTRVGEKVVNTVFVTNAPRNECEEPNETNSSEETT